MKKNLRHEWMAQRSAAIFLCGLLGIGSANVYAEAAIPEPFNVQQQDLKTIKGTVVDETGLPVPGANIIVKGTSHGTISDIDGTFSLAVNQKGVVLEVSFIGYKTLSIAYTGQTELKVSLVPEAEQLNEVVVTALGIKREKKALGYAMQEVKTDGLAENKSLSVANMLQGKIAGVQIAQSGTGMGGSTRIVMRGLNSLSGNNQPLWVVDGFPINDGVPDVADQWGGSDYAGAASQINPEDTESISVLKGANAAELYGSRAQNGAIVITTKKGKKGQPLSVEYNGSVEFSKVYSPYDYQNTYGQGSNGVWSMDAKGSWGPRMTGQTIEHWRNAYYADANYQSYALTPQEDYIKDFYETGSNITNTLTATAGGELLTGRLSFTDTRNSSVTPNFSLNRQYFDLNTQFLSKYVDMGVKLNYMREKTKNRPGQGEYGQMIQLVKMPRGIRLSDLENPQGTGNYINNQVNWSGPSDNYSNPYALNMTENGNESRRNRIILCKSKRSAERVCTYPTAIFLHEHYETNFLCKRATLS